MALETTDGELLLLVGVLDEILGPTPLFYFPKLKSGKFKDFSVRRLTTECFLSFGPSFPRDAGHSDVKISGLPEALLFYDSWPTRSLERETRPYFLAIIPGRELTEHEKFTIVRISFPYLQELKTKKRSNLIRLYSQVYPIITIPKENVDKIKLELELIYNFVQELVFRFGIEHPKVHRELEELAEKMLTEKYGELARLAIWL